MKQQRTNPAVSPVVGVMLMLTITLILAAVVSGITGGFTQTQKKPPQLMIEPSLVTGTNSSCEMAVISVSEGIPTRDLKIITEWRNSTGTTRTTLMNGSVYPYGVGPGIASSSGEPFGNYTLLAGVRMFVNNSGMSTFFGSNWEELQEGDMVTLRIIDIPAGATITERELTVGR